MKEINIFLNPFVEAFDRLKKFKMAAVTMENNGVGVTSAIALQWQF
jgi:hypothetical protein